MAVKDCNVEWLTSLFNWIAAQGRNPDYRKSSILLPVFKRTGDPNGSYRAIKLLEHALKVIERVFEEGSERKERSIQTFTISTRQYALAWRSCQNFTNGKFL